MLITDRDLLPGEVVLSERAYAYVPHDDERSVCHHSLMSILFKPVLHPECPQVRFATAGDREQMERFVSLEKFALAHLNDAVVSVERVLVCY